MRRLAVIMLAACSGSTTPPGGDSGGSDIGPDPDAECWAFRRAPRPSKLESQVELWAAKLNELVATRNRTGLNDRPQRVRASDVTAEPDPKPNRG